MFIFHCRAYFGSELQVTTHYLQKLRQQEPDIAGCSVSTVRREGKELMLHTKALLAFSTILFSELLGIFNKNHFTVMNLQMKTPYN